MTAFWLNVDREFQHRGIGIRYRLDNRLYNLARLKVKKNVRKRFLTELQYAYDLLVLASTTAEADRIMRTFSDLYSSLGVEVNTAKTKLLVMRYDQPYQITNLFPNSLPIETVE